MFIPTADEELHGLPATNNPVLVLRQVDEEIEIEKKVIQDAFP